MLEVCMEAGSRDSAHAHMKDDAQGNRRQAAHPRRGAAAGCGGTEAQPSCCTATTMTAVKNNGKKEASGLP